MYQRHLRSLWKSLEGSGFTIFSHDWLLREDKPTWGSSATRGLFFVFEGLDRSGKSTQSKKLEEYLSKAGGSLENHTNGPLPHQESLKVGVFYWNTHHISITSPGKSESWSILLEYTPHISPYILLCVFFQAHPRGFGWLFSAPFRRAGRWSGCASPIGRRPSARPSTSTSGGRGRSWDAAGWCWDAWVTWNLYDFDEVIEVPFENLSFVHVDEVPFIWKFHSSSKLIYQQIKFSTLWWTNIVLENGPVEIVNVPINSMVNLSIAM